MLLSRSSVLNELKEITKIGIGLAAELESETLEVLNFKPNENSWSILECFEHLNYYHEFYIEEINKKLNQAASAPNANHYRPGWLGNYAAQSMKPKDGKVENKMKTFPSKNPNSSSLDRDVLEAFLHHQKRLNGLLDRAETVDLGKNRCSLTFPLLSFKMGDVLRFHIFHIQRHLVQV